MVLVPNRESGSGRFSFDPYFLASNYEVYASVEHSAASAMFFVAWCCLDYRLVHSPQFPGNCADDDWQFVFVPLVTLAANLAVYRRQGLRKALLVAILATVALSVLFLVVVVVFGIPFHVSIGGTL